MKKKERTPTVDIFTERMKELRSEKGKTENRELTQKEVSETLGIHPNTLINYEFDRLPDPEILKKIKNYYNVSYEYLLGESDVKSVNVDIKAIHEKTGLSEETIKILNRLHEPKINGIIPIDKNKPIRNEKIRGAIDDAKDKITVFNLLIESTSCKNSEEIKGRSIIDLIIRYFRFDPKKATSISITDDGIITPYKPKYIGSSEVHYDKKISIDGKTLETIFLAEIEKELTNLKEKSNIFGIEKDKK